MPFTRGFNLIYKIGEFGPLLVAFVLYPLLASQLFRLKPKVMWPAFAAFNIFSTFVAGVLTIMPTYNLRPSQLPHMLVLGTVVFAVYVAMVLACFAVLVLASHNPTKFLPIAYGMPILMLVGLRDILPKAGNLDPRGSLMMLLGVSYIAFKLCHLVTDVANNVAPQTDGLAVSRL